MLSFFRRKSANIGVVIALVFAFNIFSVVPGAIQHAEADHVSHYGTADLNDLANSPIKSMHEHVETCGMTSCSFSFGVELDNSLKLASNELIYAGLEDQLNGVYHNPPHEPPKV